MIFKDVPVGDCFCIDNLYFRKVLPIIGTDGHTNLTFNAINLDDNKMYGFEKDDEVCPDCCRALFEELWENKSCPIDKALCYEFYKLGIEAQ